MSRVSPYRRRNGTRVRGHYRARGDGSSRLRRPSVRRRPARPTPDRSGWWIAAGLGGLLLSWLVVEFVRRHPGWSVVIALGVLAVVIGGLVVRDRDRARRGAWEKARALHIEVTDGMTGPQFERWTAALLTRSGFSGVSVRGGAGDRGADVVAAAPDGRRVVVQCKRHSPANRVGSAAIQRFAGTCRSIHGGDVCVIVTNGFFTTGDGLRLARELDIVLLDRTDLARWAYTGEIPGALR